MKTNTTTRNIRKQPTLIVVVLYRAVLGCWLKVCCLLNHLYGGTTFANGYHYPELTHSLTGRHMQNSWSSESPLREQHSGWVHHHSQWIINIDWPLSKPKFNKGLHKNNKFSSGKTTIHQSLSHFPFLPVRAKPTEHYIFCFCTP